MVFVTLTVITSVVADIFQCTPIEYIWNKGVAGTCIDRVTLFLSNAGLDIFQDFLIYVLPLRSVYKLYLPRKQRLALIAIFMAGGFVCITGILRLNALHTAAVTEDHTCICQSLSALFQETAKRWPGNNVATANWSTVEVCTGIFCASLVHFKPLVVRLLPHWINTSRATASSGGHSLRRAPALYSEQNRADSQVDQELGVMPMQRPTKVKEGVPDSRSLVSSAAKNLQTVPFDREGISRIHVHQSFEVTRPVNAHPVG